MSFKVLRVKHFSCDGCGEAIKPGEKLPLAKIRCPACDKPQTVPGHFGDFRLLQRLGSGSMGIVFKARDMKVKRLVAVKFITRERKTAAQPNGALAEAQAMAALNHPNIVPIYDFGVHDNHQFIEMELLDGGSAKEHFQGKRRTERGILEMGISMADALKAALAANLMHMDIKPANILYSNDGTPKLVDFGLAQAFKGGDGSFVGTPNYIAPEVAVNDPYDFRADIYSLGSTMFRLLSGRHAFPGDAKEAMRARLKNPPPHLRDVAPKVSPATANLIFKMMRRKADDRPTSYDELIQGLKGAMNASKTFRADDLLSQLAQANEDFE